jgi:transmembrane sensor
MTDPERADTTTARDEAAAHWCPAIAGGTLTPLDRQELDTWLAANSANATALGAALAVWDALDAVRDTPEVIAMRARSLESLRRINARRWSLGARRTWRVGIGIAATIAIGVVTSVWNAPDPAVQFATGVGERRIVTLEDGSRLSLDAQTTVLVDYDRDMRRLTLVGGRARFDVAHRADKPFLVMSGNRTIVARGTTFSAEMVGTHLHVILYEGRVEVVAGPPPGLAQMQLMRPLPGAAVLVPGEELVAGPDPRAPALVIPADATRTLAWETGQIDIKDEPLAVAAERFNRYSDRKLIIGDRRAAKIRVDGVFNAGDSAAFAEALGAAYPVRVTPRGDDFVIDMAAP